MERLRRPGTDALLLVADSESDADLYYATRFLVSDPITYLELDGRKLLLVADLEYGRARADADVDEVISTAPYEAALKQQGQPLSPLNILRLFLDRKGVRELIVPASFPLGFARNLEKHGFSLTCREDPLFPERTIKTAAEVAAIQKSQAAAEVAMAFVVEEIRKAGVRGGLLYRNGTTLDAEWLRTEAHKLLLELGFEASHTIIAPGDQGCDPHNHGSGPLAAGQTIVIDIFPRSSTTRYWGDISRTVLRGKASAAQRKLYDDVLAAQEHACRALRPGRNGKDIHAGVVELFKSQGNATEERDGRKTGFVHSTGHGVGLDIHEAPRVGRLDSQLEAGHVVTIEPGLYYPGLGAVRIEDLLVVTADGSRNLTSFPKELEV